MLCFQSSAIFRKNPEFLNSRNFREKVRKKVWKFKFGKKFGNYSKMYVNFETLFFGQKVRKCSEKVRKKLGNFGKISEISEKFRKLVFPNVRKFRNFRKFGNSELSENFEKMVSYLNFGNYEIFVPTRKPTRKFG